MKAMSRNEVLQYAVDKRRAGLSWMYIENVTGVPATELEPLVSDIFQKENESRHKARMLDASRLDAMLAAAWPAAEEGDLPAINTVLKVMERRSKYLGLDYSDTLADARLQLDTQQLDLVASALARALEEGGVSGGERLRVITGFVEEVRALEA